ncbi:MAG: hypothetical protein ROW48_13690 [Bellilinea sp.]
MRLCQRDALDRLTGAGYSSGESFAYSYDPVGSRLSQTVNGVTTTYAYDTAGRLLSAGGLAYAWDDNGNLLWDGINTYTYDHANRLTGISDSLSVSSYQYNGLGDRLSQTVNGVTTHYTLDLAAGLSQVLADGSQLYYYGLERIAQQPRTAAGHSSGGQPAYFLADQLGSARHLADAGGSIVRSQSFDPFGNLLSAGGSTLTNYGYAPPKGGAAGEWSDTSASLSAGPTGLLYLRARYYAPQWGQFLTRDPFPGPAAPPGHTGALPLRAQQPAALHGSERGVRRNAVRPGDGRVQCLYHRGQTPARLCRPVDGMGCAGAGRAQPGAAVRAGRRHGDPSGCPLR